jgi:signal transduction histidine kinase
MKPNSSIAQQARDQERQRIARDIHDDLGQSLLALKMELTVVKSEAPAVVGQQIDGIIRHLDASILSLRAIIRDLRPGALERGLVAAVRGQLQEFTRVSGVHHALQADPAIDEQARAVDVVTLRIVQELLANVARHAQATLVAVRLVRTDRALELTVSDNGSGTPARAIDVCYGLRGVRERAEATGGHMTVLQEDGIGTTVHVVLGLVSH